jgi:hypothetical protein
MNAIAALVAGFHPFLFQVAQERQDLKPADLATLPG